jgi:CHASE3 domain sensor protein
MVHANANPPCETFARVIRRLSAEIQRLTREIPLNQGRLQELESHPQPNEGVIQGVTDEIRAALDEMRNAEDDLVQMEILFRTNCHRSTA